jgi:hypothetical protein
MPIKVEGKDEVVDLPSDETEVTVAVPPVRAVGKFCVKNRFGTGSLPHLPYRWRAG